MHQIRIAEIFVILEMTDGPTPPWLSPPWNMTAHLPYHIRLEIQQRRKEQEDFLYWLIKRDFYDGGKTSFGSYRTFSAAARILTENLDQRNRFRVLGS